jgi:hypothetical protein
MAPREKQPPVPIGQEAGWAPQPGSSLWRAETTPALTGNGTTISRSSSLWLLCHEDMGSGGIAPPSLTSALDEGEWSASRPGRFTTWERAPDTHWIRGWVDPRVSLERCGDEKIFAPSGFEPGPSRPWPYRLSYPDSCLIIILTDLPLPWRKREKVNTEGSASDGPPLCPQLCRSIHLWQGRAHATDGRSQI